MSSVVRRLVALAAFACAAAHGGEPWPVAPVPTDAKPQLVAEDMVVNGRRSRVLRYEVARSEEQLLAFYREHFGARRVENRVKNTQVIATRQGDYFQTVQLQPTGPDRVQVTVMTTSLRQADSKVSAETRGLLPAQSAVLMTMQSNDTGKQSLMVVAANKASLQANRDHLVSALASQGFKVEREELSQADGKPALALSLASGSEEVTMTLTDTGPYRSLVINRTREPK